MLDVRKCVTMAVLCGILSYFVFSELQEVTVSFTETVIVPAERREISQYFLEQPEAMAEFHPFGVGVSDVQRTWREDNPKKIKELRYIMHQKAPSVVLWGGNATSNFEFRFHFTEPDSLVNVSGKSELGFMGLIKFRMKGSFLMADYKGKEERNTLVVDFVSFKGPRGVVTRLFLAKAPAAHRIILNKLREFFANRKTR